MNWGISKSQTFLVCAFLFLLILLGWRIFSAPTAIRLPPRKTHYQPQEDIIPNLSVETLRVAYSRGGAKERILEFARAKQSSGPDGPIYEVEKPVVTMAKIGDMKFTLEAEEGSFDPLSGDWTLAGNVHAASGTEREFFADKAQYFAARDSIVAWGEDRPIRIVWKGLNIEAREFETDSSFNEITFPDAHGEMEAQFLPESKEQVNEEQ
jgi:hypothetical protein